MRSKIVLKEELPTRCTYSHVSNYYLSLSISKYFYGNGCDKVCFYFFRVTFFSLDNNRLRMVASFCKRNMKLFFFIE